MTLDILGRRIILRNPHGQEWDGMTKSLELPCLISIDKLLKKLSKLGERLYVRTRCFSKRYNLETCID